MNTFPRSNRNERPESWGDILGPVCMEEDLPATIIGDSGLISLKTTDGMKICPMFQFARTEDGTVDLYPDLSVAWQIMTSLHTNQLNESPWTSTARLMSSREELGGKSWSDILIDPNTSIEEKKNIHIALVDDAIKAAKWSGVTLSDPRKTLGS